MQDLVAKEQFWEEFEGPFVEMEFGGIEAPDCAYEVKSGDVEGESVGVIGRALGVFGGGRKGVTLLSCGGLAGDWG